jgi:hypothetical protein
VGLSLALQGGGLPGRVARDGRQLQHQGEQKRGFVAGQGMIYYQPNKVDNKVGAWHNGFTVIERITGQKTKFQTST